MIMAPMNNWDFDIQYIVDFNLKRFIGGAWNAAYHYIWPFLASLSGGLVHLFHDAERRKKKMPWWYFAGSLFASVFTGVIVYMFLGSLTDMDDQIVLSATAICACFYRDFLPQLKKMFVAAIERAGK